MAARDITMDEALAQVRMPSYERLRAEHMGWKFGEPTIKPCPFGYELHCSFTCVCGRREEFSYTSQHLYGFTNFRIADWLEKNGSFSRPHLLQDGYTEQQIADIERRGEEFDRIVAERYERDLMRHCPETFYTLKSERARQCSLSG